MRSSMIFGCLMALILSAACDLTITTKGGGSVKSLDGQIECAEECVMSYDAAPESITLIAQPDEGWHFAGWEGDCSGADTCDVSIGPNSGDKTVTAKFVEDIFALFPEIYVYPVCKDCESEVGNKLKFIANDGNFPTSGYPNPKNSNGGFTVRAQKNRAEIELLVQALGQGDFVEAYNIATNPDGLHLLACKMVDNANRPILFFKAISGRSPRSAEINLLWRIKGQKNLIMESPHSGDDGSVIFANARQFYFSSALAMICNEYTRHASRIKSGCDGNSGDYEISDVAHATTSLFHYTHKILSELFLDALVLNLHGMGKSGNGIAISNGLSYGSMARPESALSVFTDEFLDHDLFGSDGNMKSDFTSCQGGTAFSKRNRVCGTTNVQGRHLNQSPAPCTQRGRVDSDRFIHVEQGAYIRNNPSRQRALAEVWDRMVEVWEYPYPQ